MERQNMWIVESRRLPMASVGVCAAPLTQHGTIVAVGENGLCHLYSPRHRRWQALPPMIEKERCACCVVRLDEIVVAGRWACCVVPLDDEIVVLGGYNGSSSLLSVERLKLNDEGQPLGSWKAARRMRQARHNCAAVVAEGKIVVVGGYDSKSSSCLSSAEMFDPLKNTWKRLPDMATKRCGCAAVAIRDKIFVFGGHDGSSCLNSAKYLCIDTKKWHSLPPMRKRRSYPAAVAIGGRILVVGGRDEEGRKLSDVGVLDTSTMRWEENHDIPSLNTGRSRHGATTVENRIYIVGGEDNNGNWLGNILDTMEILEVQEAPHPSQPDLEAEIAKRDSEIAKLNAGIAKRDTENAKLNAEIAKLRTQIARERTKTRSQEPLVSTTSIQEPTPQPDYSEFETRIDLEAEAATLRKKIQDCIDSFESDAITLAAQEKKRLRLFEELLKTMPTIQQLKSDIFDLEEGIRALGDQDRLEEAIPLARKHEELTEQLRKEEMALIRQATLRGHGDSED